MTLPAGAASDSVTEIEAGSDAQSGGLFDAAARQQAVASALPLLATYFASGDSWELRPQAALDPDSEADGELAAAIRLRVMLALGRELIEIASAIAGQPSFRYGRRSGVSVGVVAGRLDLFQQLRSQGQIDSPRRYPIHLVERHLATDENLLAAGALHAIGHGLSTAPTHVLPKAGPERREIAEIQSALARLGQLPLFASLRDAGRQLARQGRLDRCRARVLRRLNRREITHPEPYVALVDWVGNFLSGSGPMSGEKAWAFYDRRFDPRLFEIWLLSSIATALTRRLGEPVSGSVRPLWWRDEEPQASWLTSFGKVELFFQREARSIGLSGRWELRERGHRLRAIPDMVVRLTTADRVRCLLIDAKLRRYGPLPESNGDRLNLPAEEIYKMLGYFEHLAPDPGPVGVLAYYTPGFCRSAKLKPVTSSDVAGGSLFLAGLDPGLAKASDSSMDEIADFISDLLGEPSAQVKKEADRLARDAIESGAGELEAAAVRKGRLFQEIAAGYASRHPDQLKTVETTTRASYSAEVWGDLEDATQRMLVSAEMYALHQPPEMDFSGPLLVLCTACERELNRRLFRHLAAEHGDERDENDRPLVPAHPTLGQAITVVRRAAEVLHAEEKEDEAKLESTFELASTESEERLWRIAAEHLKGSGHSRKEIADLVECLGALNKKYRRPSAHDQVVERSVWVEGRGAVLGPTQTLSKLASIFPTTPPEGTEST